VIGNGSSGIQVTAAVQKVASHVSVYIRNPTWVTANMGSRFIPKGQKNLFFDAEQKEKWAKNPEEYLQYRKEVEKELNIRFPLFVRGTPQQAMALDFTIKDMKSRLTAKPELADILLPTFAVGCRRPTPGSGYLEALCASNCEVVWGELDTFTPTGIKSAGSDAKTREFDVVIAATGFDMSFVPRWPIVGKNGIDLQKEWSEDPACYMSTVAENMPNYFVYLGPGSPVGHGSLITSIERITVYICDIINKLQTENYSSFLLKQGKARAYQAQMLAWLDKTVWGDSCQSSFKNGTVNGALHAFHPGSRLHYFELLKRHRYEDFEWTSACKEPELDFAWFNNGFLSHELDPNEEEDPTSVHSSPSSPNSMSSCLRFRFARRISDLVCSQLVSGSRPTNSDNVHHRRNGLTLTQRHKCWSGRRRAGIQMSNSISHRPLLSNLQLHLLPSDQSIYICMIS
jgi:hypothetical protein